MEFSLEIRSTKTYTDVGVQTSTTTSVTLDQLSEIVKEKINSTNTTNIKRPVIPVVAADNGTKKEELSYIETRKSALPYNRPSKFSRHTAIDEGSSRTASLPECILAEALGGHVQPTFISSVDVSARSISMPSTYKSFSRISTQTVDHSNDILQASPSFSIDGAEYARIHVSPRTPDLPHTPSSSSSFDSIEIIQNSLRLPENFLKAEDLPRNVRSDSDGWLTWANSPPRPIPALHGPASLPYARCPSGAEGIIIEEPSNVPRLIWGLRGITEDVSTMLQPQSPLIAPTQNTNIRNESKVENFCTASDFKSPKANLQPHKRNVVMDNQYGRENDYKEFWAYNTATTKHSNSAAGIGTYESVPTTSAEKLLEFASRANNAGIDARFGDVVGKNLDYLSTSERNKSAKSISSANIKPMPEIDAYSREHRSYAAMLRANAAPFVPDNQGSASRLPVPLEGQTVENSSNHSDTFNSLCTDISWYLQQQAQQHLLPTPPNSASPLWSSNFSPIPNVSVSPNAGKALMVKSSPGSDMLQYPSIGIQKLDELSRELRHLMYNENSNHGKALRNNGALNSEASTFKITSPVTSPMRTMTRTSDVYLPIHLKDLVPNSNLNGIVIDSVSRTQFTDPICTYKMPFVDSYPSPSSPIESSADSPESQFTRPYPRSSNLNINLQRRLSDVPEEELNSSVNSLNERTAKENMSSKVKHSRECRCSDNRNYKNVTVKQNKHFKTNAPVSSVANEKRDGIDKENWARKKRTRSRK